MDARSNSGQNLDQEPNITGENQILSSNLEPFWEKYSENWSSLPPVLLLGRGEYQENKW